MYINRLQTHIEIFQRIRLHPGYLLFQHTVVNFPGESQRYREHHFKRKTERFYFVYFTFRELNAGLSVPASSEISSALHFFDLKIMMASKTVIQLYSTIILIMLITIINVVCGMYYHN